MVETPNDIDYALHVIKSEIEAQAKDEAVGILVRARQGVRDVLHAHRPKEWHGTLVLWEDWKRAVLDLDGSLELPILTQLCARRIVKGLLKKEQK